MSKSNGKRQGPVWDPLVVRTEDLAQIIDGWAEAFKSDLDNGDAYHNFTRESAQAGGKRVKAYAQRTRPGIVTRMGYIEYLVHWSGVNERTIWSIRARKTKHTALRVADALLTAIDQAPQAYHDGRVQVIPNPLMSREKYEAWLLEEGRVCSN